MVDTANCQGPTSWGGVQSHDASASRRETAELRLHSVHSTTVTVATSPINQVLLLKLHMLVSMNTPAAPCTLSMPMHQHTIYTTTL